MIGILFIVLIIFIIFLCTFKKCENTSKEGMFLYDKNKTIFPENISHITHNLMKSANGNNNKNIRILTNIGSAGLKYDAEIYNKLIDDSYIVCYFNKYNIPDEEKSKIADINIHMEKIWWPLNNSEILKSKENWLVVNQEFFMEKLSDLKYLDKIICKTKYAHKLFQQLKNEYNLNCDVVYVGHTSLSPQIVNYNKNELIFLHCAGQSPLKNTELLIKVWHQLHKTYPHIKLYITCKSYCKYVTNSNLLQTKDGVVYKDYYPDDEFNSLTRECICYVCPSLVEGFGHYINEGRANGCAIITVDAPPMNELVINDKNGLLIPYKQEVDSYKFTHSYLPKIFTDYYYVRCKNSNAYLISFNDLYNTIEKFINYSYDTKIRMCKNSRKMYEIDNYYFQKRLDNLI